MKGIALGEWHGTGCINVDVKEGNDGQGHDRGRGAGQAE